MFPGFPRMWVCPSDQVTPIRRSWASGPDRFLWRSCCVAVPLNVPGETRFESLPCTWVARLQGFFDTSWSAYLGLIKTLRERGVNTAVSHDELSFEAENHEDAEVRTLIDEYLTVQQRSYRLGLMHGRVHQRVNRMSGSGGA